MTTDEIKALLVGAAPDVVALALRQAQEIERLREALEPLAAMASRYDPEDGDGDLECWSGLAVPKIRHLRAARAALAGEGQR